MDQRRINLDMRWEKENWRRERRNEKRMKGGVWSMDSDENSIIRLMGME